MLAQANRLRKKKDFEKVFKKGRNFKEDFLFLKMAENGLKESRFGFVVSQKTAKKAVTRNKIKRRLQEALRGALKRTKKGYDVVLVARPESAEKDFETTEQTLIKLLKKAQLLQNHD